MHGTYHREEAAATRGEIEENVATANDVFVGQPQRARPDQVAAGLRHCEGLSWLDSGSGYSYVAATPVQTVHKRVRDLTNDLSFLGSLLPHPTEAKWPVWIGNIDYGAYRGAPGFKHVSTENRAEIVFHRYDATYRFDHAQRTGNFIGTSREACERLEAAVQPGTPIATCYLGAQNVTPADQHRGAIRSALNGIFEGRYYQLNLARTWTADFDGSPLDFYQAMRAQSPVPHGVYLALGNRTLCGRTMETYLEYDGTFVRSSPIKGTQRSDLAAETLRENTKERAEHAMIVDLIRNDLSRCARVGSVQVDNAFRIDSFGDIHHMISDVVMTPKADLEWSELIATTFPPGSVTGTPKVAAVQAIHDLEGIDRNAYCGSVGAIFNDGSARFTVSIRTAQIEGGHIRYHAGGGIVADSDADKEIDETEIKAGVFVRTANACIPGV